MPDAMFDLVVSIVAYNTPPSLLQAAMGSVLGSDLRLRLVVVDHSPAATLAEAMPGDARVEYRHNPGNPGFGAGHNGPLAESLLRARYHLVLNPDVDFTPDVLRALFEFMEREPGVGLVTPRTIFPSGEVQYLCKLLPTPLDVFARRFLPFREWVEKRNARYEMKFTNYNQIMDVPYISGSFMFLRCSALQAVGLFDENFFMYFEDTDLTRRIRRHQRTVFFPNSTVTHHYGKTSYKNVRILLVHVRSALHYFTKWGWCFDPERSRVNHEILRSWKQARKLPWWQRLKSKPSGENP